MSEKQFRQKFLDSGDCFSHGPVRMCVVCRRRMPKQALRRYILTPHGELGFDAEKKSPGRGWYLCTDPVCGQKFARFRPCVRRKGVKS